VQIQVVLAGNAADERGEEANPGGPFDLPFDLPRYF
jgi:hypothetical protein